MTYGVARTNTFEFGRVIDRTFAAFRDNFGQFFIVAILLSAIPSVIAQSAVIAMPATGAVAPVGILIRGLFQILGGILALVLQAALIWGTVTYLNGRRAPMQEVLGVGLRAFLPFLGLAICFGFAVLLGFLLLIVPGLILLVVWSVSVPALVVERIGVFASFTRSTELTRGHRWTIFGLGLLLWVATSVVGAVVGVLVGVIFYGGVTPAAALTAHSPIAYVGALIMGLFTAAIAVLSAVATGVLYFELRAAREGVGPQTVAQVFE